MIEKENALTTYSKELSTLLLKFRGGLDAIKFQIAVMTDCEERDIAGLVSSFVERKYGKCVFHKPIVQNDGHIYRHTIYASRLSEEEIIKILNLKAFW